MIRNMKDRNIYFPFLSLMNLNLITFSINYLKANKIRKLN